MKRPFIIILCLLVILIQPALHAQHKPSIANDVTRQTFEYAVKDSTHLGLDVYQLKNSNVTKRPCMMFVFGGGFIAGHRDDSIYNAYFNTLVQRGYVVVSISYRLGLKGVKKLSIWHTAPLQKAVTMAVDDLYDATNWVIEHAAQLDIDTSKILVSGSSSGGITALTGEYLLCNRTDAAKKLPASFKYSGVITFSGAVLLFKSGLNYHTPPAPTLLFHGTADNLVPYKKLRFLNNGFFGSSYLAKEYKKKKYHYYFYSAVNRGHEIAALPMIENLNTITAFLDDYIDAHKPLQVNVSWDDMDAKPMMRMDGKEMLNKQNQK